jgi:hypothetical protein
MSTGEHKQLISGLVDEVWTSTTPRRSTATSAPASGEVAEHYDQLLGGFPDLQVTIEAGLIAEGDMVVARLMLMGTPPDRSRAETPAAALRAGRRSGSTASLTTRSSRPGPCRTASGSCSSWVRSPNLSRSTGRVAGEPVTDRDVPERSR